MSRDKHIVYTSVMHIYTVGIKYINRCYTTISRENIQQNNNINTHTQIHIMRACVYYTFSKRGYYNVK